MQSLESRLDLQCPIIQAPMAGTASPALAAAVSNAGGLGSISIAAVNSEAGRRMIRELRGLTERSFNVNVFCHRPSVIDVNLQSGWLEYLAPWFAEFGVPQPPAIEDIYTSFCDGNAQLQVLLEERPAVVSFHLGLPPDGHIQALRAAGILLLASATSISEGLAAQSAGVDWVVAQGIEAGGHRGIFDPHVADHQLGTLALVQQLTAALDVPVIAAGGLMNGGDIRTALASGASAAQLGTAFILCPESAANAAYRKMLGSRRAADTTLTQVISGRPARGIVNRFTREVGAPGHPQVPGFGIAYDAGKQLIAAAANVGNPEFAAHWAGQGALQARELPAAQLLALLRREME